MAFNAGKVLGTVLKRHLSSCEWLPSGPRCQALLLLPRHEVLLGGGMTCKSYPSFSGQANEFSHQGKGKKQIPRHSPGCILISQGVEGTRAETPSLLSDRHSRELFPMSHHSGCLICSFNRHLFSTHNVPCTHRSPLQVLMHVNFATTL